VRSKALDSDPAGYVGQAPASTHWRMGGRTDERARSNGRAKMRLRKTSLPSYSSLASRGLQPLGERMGFRDDNKFPPSIFTPTTKCWDPIRIVNSTK